MHFPPILIPLIASIVVYVDARAIGIKKGLMPGFFNIGAGTWGFACFLFLIIALPAYLLKRGQYQHIIAEQKAQALLQQRQEQTSSPSVWPPPSQSPPGASL